MNNEVSESMLFNALGFKWERPVTPISPPTHSIERVAYRFQRMLPEFVWDASVLEGNPITFPGVMTLLDGVTVGGHKLSDQNQTLNLINCSKHLFRLVKSGDFELSKSIFIGLDCILSRNVAIECGVFRGEGQETSFTPEVSLGKRGLHTLIPTEAEAPKLNQVFKEGISLLAHCQPVERATAFFLFGALQQFFFDGNKRTSRFMMNGIDAISVPAAKAQEFNEKMVRFYLTKDGTEMMRFLLDCHPDAEVIKN